MVVAQQRDEACGVEPARHNAVHVGVVAQREGDKVALEAVIAARRAVGRDDEQLLVVGPAQALDGALVPGNGAHQLARAAVHVDGRLGHAGPAVRVQLVLVTIDGCQPLLAYYNYARAREDEEEEEKNTPRRGRHACIPTYSTAVRRPNNIVLVELQVLIKDGRVQLHLAVELVAHLFPVGSGLGHGEWLAAQSCVSVISWRVVTVGDELGVDLVLGLGVGVRQAAPMGSCLGIPLTC